jgi:hypothetical protein
MFNKPCGCHWETTGNLRVQHFCQHHNHVAQQRTTK